MSAHEPEIKIELDRSCGSDSSTCSLLAVRQVPLLTSGGLSTVLATGQPVILIGVDQPHSEKLIALWHEVVHLLREAGGYDQDEISVEDAARRLAAACPEALEWVGILEANDQGLATASRTPASTGDVIAVANAALFEGVEPPNNLP